LYFLEDTFGADDQDWMVYREIVSEITESFSLTRLPSLTYLLKNREEESEDEEEDVANLNHYESLLLQYDPEFLPEHAFEAAQDPTNTLLHLLRHGMYPKYDQQDVGQTHQLHVNVERIRVPEVLFQPNIIGLDQAGIVENINDIVRVYDASRKQNMVKVRVESGTNT
jgi:actin-related protein 5